jgi:hypothetical protein
MPRIKLTERIIPRLRGRPASSKSREPVIYFDISTPGFGVSVSTKTGLKSYVIQRDLPNGKTRRVAIAAVKEISLEDAREKANDFKYQMRHGIDPKAARRGGLTLKEAMDAYLATHELREKSVREYRRSIECCLEDWCELKLTEINRTMVEERHQALANDRGKATANGVMRVLRALFNDAMDRYQDVSANPVRLRRQWFRVPRRERHVSADDLPKF